MTPVVVICFVGLAVAALLIVVRLVQGPSVPDRIVALDTLLQVVVAGIAVAAALTRRPDPAPYTRSTHLRVMRAAPWVAATLVVLGASPWLLPDVRNAQDVAAAPASSSRTVADVSPQPSADTAGKPAPAAKG